MNADEQQRQYGGYSLPVRFNTVYERSINKWMQRHVDPPDSHSEWDAEVGAATEFNITMQRAREIRERGRLEAGAENAPIPARIYGVGQECRYPERCPWHDEPRLVGRTITRARVVNDTGTEWDYQGGDVELLLDNGLLVTIEGYGYDSYGTSIEFKLDL